MCISQYCKDIPKAELHIHIEGTLEPELMFELAKKNNIDLPYNTIEDVKKAYSFANLQDFLDIYYQGSSVLIDESDFYQLMMAYLEKANSDTIKRAEIFFDPQTHTDRGVAFETVVKGFDRAIKEMQAKTGISCDLIMCFLRHLGGKEALKTMQNALPYKQYFFAVGMDSSELGFLPELFVDAYDLARENNLHLVAHAGEEGGPCYIEQALDLLHIERIDHGVRIVEDEALLQRVIDKRTPLTMCPLSNLKLCIVDDLKDHPIKKLLDMGCCVTVNSDDPSYFGGYLTENYIQIAQALNLSKDDIYQLAKNSFEASFISDEEKNRYYNMLESFNTAFCKA